MRKPKYLSPTSIACYYQNPEEYYTRYLADVEPPRFPQTQPMSVGSSFDAYIKSHLHQTLFGKSDPKFDFQTIFEAQVEPQNRDFALKAGKFCFCEYQKWGSLADLMIELQQAGTDPRFEFTVEGRVAHSSCVDGIPMSGKPDVFFHLKDGCAVVLDWKVNGYCSKASPAKGYIMIRGDPSFRGLVQAHKDAMPMASHGLTINMASTLEMVNQDWANQLSIYAWLLGENVGSQFIAGIDQLTFTDGRCRTAKHRCHVGKTYQEEVLNKAAYIWNLINSNHYFKDLTVEESARRCAMLDNMHNAYIASNDPKEKWFQETTRQHRSF